MKTGTNFYTALTDLRIRSSPVIADDTAIGLIYAGSTLYEVGQPFFTWRHVVAPCTDGVWREGFCAAEYEGTPLLQPLVPTCTWGSPVKSPQRISQLYGENPAIYGTLGYKGHNGIDLATIEGTLIHAVADGMASMVRFDPAGYGHYVRIDHPGQGISLYAHLAQTVIREGQSVTSGQIIGISGNSGMSTGAHLHYEIRMQPYNEQNGFGGRVDPLPFTDPSFFIWPSYAPALTPR